MTSLKQSHANALAETLRLIFLLLFAALILFPFLWMVFAAFKPEEDIFLSSFTLLPTRWVFTNFRDALQAAPFVTFGVNSLIIAGITIAAQALTCTGAAYAFARLEFPCKKVIFTLFLAMMMIPEEASLISNYLLVRSLGLTNTHFGIAMIQLTSVFSVFLLRQSFMTIPADLFNSAKLDGCEEFRAFFYVALPNAGSAIATVVLLAFLYSWNAYMWPYIVTSSNNMRTLQIGLKYLIRPDAGPEWPAIMAASTMILLPIILLFVFLQKYFVAGMVNSGIK